MHHPTSERHLPFLVSVDGVDQTRLERQRNGDWLIIQRGLSRSIVRSLRRDYDNTEKHNKAARRKVRSQVTKRSVIQFLRESKLGRLAVGYGMGHGKLVTALNASLVSKEA